MAVLRHCARVAQGFRSIDKLVDTLLCGPPHSLPSKFKLFLLQNILGKEHYRLKINQGAEYLPTSPSQGSATGARMKVLQYMVSAQTLLHTEELICWATIYSSIMDSLVTSLIERIPVEDRDKVIQEQVKIMSKDYVERRACDLSWWQPPAYIWSEGMWHRDNSCQG